MKHLKKFNESVDNSDITYGSIVKYKENMQKIFKYMCIYMHIFM